MRGFIPLLIALSLLIPCGYAISYSGEAVTDGEVSAVCLSLGAYTWDGSDYATTSNILSEKVPVTKTGTTYSANPSSYPLSQDVFLKVYGADSANLSWSATITGDFSSSVLSVSLDSAELAQGESRLVSNGYHSLGIAYSGSYSGAAMPTLDISIEFSAYTMCSGSYQSVSDCVRLKASSPESVQEIMVENNEDLVTDGGYTISTTTSTNHGGDYPAIGLRNDGNPRGGIANNNGQINVSVNVPQGYLFVIYLRTTTNTSNTFDIVMKNSGETVLNGTVTFNSGIGATGRYLSEKSSDGSSTGYFYSSLDQVDAYGAWMSGDSSDYTIEITTTEGESASRNLMMDFVFKKE